MIWPIPRSLGLSLGHIGALLGLAVPTIAGAVVDLGGGVNPDLAGDARSFRGFSGLTRCSGGRRGGGCRRTPGFNASMAATRARSCRPAERRAVLAGGGDRGRGLRVTQHQPGSEAPGQRTPRARYFASPKPPWFQLDRTSVHLNQGADIRVGAALIVEVGLRNAPTKRLLTNEAPYSGSREGGRSPPSETRPTATMWRLISTI